MTTETAKMAVEAIKFSFNPSGYLIERLAKKVIAEESTSPTAIDDLRLLAERQEIEMKMAEAQARVAQELALASRIETAEEVEMEEYYDTSGEGSLGVQATEGTLSLGASGSGRKVSKRVFRFKGNTTRIPTNELGATTKS
ncbi:hypothetical protein HWE04_05575 [Herbaspirillum sp. C7C2]|uniref:hypothetical protein n=1 Tax=Herbaspirillum sp. C7C2 TaxID=2736666 RepID=UPI001F51A6EA|nr:hypothetical protein [Herbaspirillum sp. C7C2]MCI1013311.1 hypothetical protein [Herbaspirillum sp. C7C2]